MSHTSPISLAAAAAVLLAGFAAHAQAVAPVAPAAVADAPAPMERRIQRVTVEDAGSRIDEVRYGGETQSITVQTPGAMPRYDVIPAHGARQRPAGERDGAPGSTGKRVWTIGNF